MSNYVHKVYGTPRAIVQDEKTGWLREATPEEADAIGREYGEALMRSFAEVPYKPGLVLELERKE